MPTIAPSVPRSSGRQSAGGRRRIFTQVANFNHFITQTCAWWNKQFVGLVTLLVFDVVKLFKVRQTGFALRLTAFRALTDPLQLFLD